MVFSFLQRSLFVAAAVCAAWPAAASRCRAEAQIDDTEGRPQVSWQESDQVLGQTAFVYGKVIAVPSAGRVTFINFDANTPVKFAGVIFSENLKNFPTPPAELYDGKIVRIRGRVAQFRDSLEIAIAGPEQVEVLAALPESFIPEKPAPRQPAPGELTVAAYNIKNLFDDVDDPYREDEGTPAKPREELAALARSITDLNADVLALEEVENRGYLERFIEVFLPDMGYDHVVLVEGNDVRGIDVALVSRIPVGAVRSHQHLRFPRTDDGTPERFQRDALCVELRPPAGRPFQAWVVHLKSKRGDQADETEPIRLAESTKLRELLDAELFRDPAARFVVLGDFNDTIDSKPMKAILGQGSRALWPANADASQPGYVTFNEGEYRSVIDYILCSPAMAKCYVKGTFHVLQGSVEATGSDHNPVAAVFKSE